jgi:hypothetical protein
VSSTSMPSLISVVRCATSSMCWMPGDAGISPCALASACRNTQHAWGNCDLVSGVAALGCSARCQPASTGIAHARPRVSSPLCSECTCCSCVSVMKRRATCHSRRAEAADVLIFCPLERRDTVAPLFRVSLTLSATWAACTACLQQHALP